MPPEWLLWQSMTAEERDSWRKWNALFARLSLPVPDNKEQTP